MQIRQFFTAQNGGDVHCTIVILPLVKQRSLQASIEFVSLRSLRYVKSLVNLSVKQPRYDRSLWNQISVHNENENQHAL